MSPVPNARAEVLARIRAALGPDRSQLPDVADLPDSPADPRPPLGTPALLDLLTERLVDYRAKVIRTDPAGLPDTLARLLDRLPEATRAVVPPGLPASWGLAASPRTITDEPALTADQLDRAPCVLTACAVAIAVTGTIVLDHAPDQGRRALTLVPDRHVCVVRADQVVRDVPDAIARLGPDRPLTLVSGPSATSDIELQRVEGVHGPRTLQVVLVG